MSKSEELVYVALGGAGEIGMNMYLYGVGKGKDRRWIIVDCGVTFGNMASSPGIDLVLPDIDFIAAERKKLVGIFITHAHEDHVGALGRYWRRLKVPIYCTPFTAEVARRKLSEAGLGDKDLRVVQPHETIEAGPFSCRYFPVTHSIPQAMSLVIDTPAGRVFHTGDFKLDPDPLIGPPVDEAALAALGQEGVLAITCDSTNVFEPGLAGSEASVRADLEKVVRDCEGAVAATTFASNVARLRTLGEIAKATDRSLVVAGRAMNRMIEAALETGAIPDFPDTISDEAAQELPAEHLLYLVTGSQGEGRAALGRIAAGNHPAITLGDGDTVIYSSRTIPGNEAEVYRTYNKLSEQGVRVVDADAGLIHVSGHGNRDDIRRMYELLKPKLAIPLHGEHRHLAEHARMALEWGAEASAVVPNGTMVQIAPDTDDGPLSVVDDVETGRVYIDGDTFVGAMDGVIRSRLKLARQGHVSVALVLDEDGTLIADPEVRCFGAPEDGENWPAPLEEMIG
ncbi:MAG: ribonuclease J, partial [Pseudomonadota bacterium]